MTMASDVLFVDFFAFAWRAAHRLYRKSVEQTIRADVALIQAALSLLTFQIFYGLFENVPIQIVFATVQSSLALLYRWHVASVAGSYP
jgi:hypothetical protein